MSIHYRPAALSSTNRRHHSPSRLEVFQLRAWARAYLWAACEFDLHEAVDVLQRDAERDGLVAEIGQDAVQRFLAEAFGGVVQ
jgi:hypothetical protein